MTHRSSRFSSFLIVALTACSTGHDDHAHGDEAGHAERPHDGDAAHADEVRLSPEALSRSGVELGRPAPRLMGRGTRIPAEIQLIPQRTAHIAPLSRGRLIEVRAEPGQRVEAGQVLAVVSSSEVATLAARREQLTAQLSAARVTLERQKKLTQDGIAAQRVVIEAESTVRQLQAELAGVNRQLELLGAKDGRPELPLVSPIAGIIVEAHATLGEMTRDDEPPFVVSDPSQVWVVGLVPELDIADVAVGRRARLRLGAYPEGRWEGEIVFVSPSLDAAARALPIRLVLDNPDGKLRAGLFGTLELIGGDDQPVPTLPADALVILDGREAVFVAGAEPGAFRPTFVTLGRREGGFVEVTGGLAADAEVVVRGAYTLKSALQKGELATHEH